MRKRKRLLVVEGDPDIARLYRILFEGFPYTMKWAGDLELARATVAGALPRAPDLMLLDLPFSEAGGLDFCVELKARWPWLPIIVLSTQPPLRAAALAAGATAFVTKPFDPDRLVAEVERLLPAADGSAPACIAASRREP